MNMHTHTVNDKSVNKQKHAKVKEKSRKNGEGIYLSLQVRMPFQALFQ